MEHFAFTRHIKSKAIRLTSLPWSRYTVKQQNFPSWYIIPFFGLIFTSLFLWSTPVTTVSIDVVFILSMASHGMVNGVAWGMSWYISWLDMKLYDTIRHIITSHAVGIYIRRQLSHSKSWAQLSYSIPNADSKNTRCGVMKGGYGVRDLFCAIDNSAYAINCRHQPYNRKLQN